LVIHNEVPHTSMTAAEEPLQHPHELA